MNGLKQFDDNTLDSAIESCRKTLELPPTLPRFIGLCSNFSNRHSLVPKPRQGREDYRSKTGDEALMAIKQMLGIRK